MTYDVVVLIEREMSEGDARRVAALHARREESVDYHLLDLESSNRGNRRSDGPAGVQFRRRCRPVGSQFSPYDDGDSPIRSSTWPR